MTRLLDHSQAGEIADEIYNSLADAGYTIEEIIPGLVTAIVKVSGGDDALLDEAANLLADGGVQEDGEDLNSSFDDIEPDYFGD